MAGVAIFRRPVCFIFYDMEACFFLLFRMRWGSLMCEWCLICVDARFFLLRFSWESGGVLDVWIKAFSALI